MQKVFHSATKSALQKEETMTVFRHRRLHMRARAFVVTTTHGHGMPFACGGLVMAPWQARRSTSPLDLVGGNRPQGAARGAAPTYLQGPSVPSTVPSRQPDSILTLSGATADAVACNSALARFAATRIRFAHFYATNEGRTNEGISGLAMGRHACFSRNLLI